MTRLIPSVDSATKLFPEPTMQALSDAIGISEEEIKEAVDEYLTDNPPSQGEPLLEAHLVDQAPHPVYDDIPSLSLIFQNGLV